MDMIPKLSTLVGGWTRVVNVLGSTKQNSYAITGALNSGQTSKSQSYKLTDAHINEIATDAGTKDFLLICAGEVEFGKFASVFAQFLDWGCLYVLHTLSLPACLPASLLHVPTCLPPCIFIALSVSLALWFRYAWHGRNVFRVAHRCRAYHPVTRANGWTSKRNAGGWKMDRNVDGKYDCDANRGGYIFADYPPKPLYGGAQCGSGHHMGLSLACH